MIAEKIAARIAVCSWSLEPKSPADLVEKLSATGILRVQLALDPLRESPAVWSSTHNLFQEHGITIVSGMFGCVGENYSTLESIRKTGGVRPDVTWDRNLKNIRAAAALADSMDLKLVTFHAGFLPRDSSDPAFDKMLTRLETIAHIFQGYHIDLGLETGQEPAAALATFLKRLNQPNMGVNLDTANLILYNTGDAVDAARTLAPWLKQIHVKDATHTKVPGTWGEEVPVGTGEVKWPEFFDVLRQLNFKGNFVIEREAGKNRVADIRTARALVEHFN